MKITARTARRWWLLVAVLCLVLAATLGVVWRANTPTARLKRLENAAVPHWVTQDFIRVGGPSRRGTRLEDFNAVVVHYVGNPGTTAQQNRNYFDNPLSEVSSHFVVGLEGEIIQCLPLNEFSAASNHRNRDTISIEVCHPDDTGVFNQATYDSLVKLTAWLLDVGNLDNDCVIRHYDVTGKECPRYFVRHPEEWTAFCRAVTDYRATNAEYQ